MPLIITYDRYELKVTGTELLPGGAGKVVQLSGGPWKEMTSWMIGQ